MEDTKSGQLSCQLVGWWLQCLWPSRAGPGSPASCLGSGGRGCGPLEQAQVLLSASWVVVAMAVAL